MVAVSKRTFYHSPYSSNRIGRFSRKFDGFWMPGPAFFGIPQVLGSRPDQNFVENVGVVRRETGNLIFICVSRYALLKTSLGI